MPHADIRPATLSEDGLSVAFTLANGEVITVRLDDEGPLAAAPGLRLHVSVTRGTLLMQPSSGNAVLLTTPNALAEQQQVVNSAVAARDEGKSKGGKR